MAGKNNRSEIYDFYFDVFDRVRKKMKNPQSDPFNAQPDRDDPDDPVAARVRKWDEMSGENKPGYEYYHYMYTPEQIQRRARTAVRYEQTACEKLKYRGGIKNFRTYWLHMASLPLKGGYDSVDIFSDVVMAAAIWILDELSVSGKLDELYPFIRDACEYDCSDVIRYFHPSYDSELISALINVIRHRNDDLYEPDGFKHNWADPWTSSVVRDVSRQSGKRENFEGVMALLDEQAVKNAMQRYENKVWDFIRIAFTINDALETRFRRYDYDIDAIEIKLRDAFRKQLKGGSGKQAAPVLSPLMMPGVSPQEMGNAEMDRLENEKDRLIREQRELESKIMTAFSSMAYENEREKWAQEWKGLAPDSLLKELVSFSVDDPYESAFALLALLDGNSDIPWLFYGSVAVFYTIIDQLPVTHSMYLRDGFLKGNIRRGKADPDYQMDYESGHRFDRVHNADGENVVRNRAENLAQKIYARSFMLLPRVRREIAGLDEMMQEIGAETEREKQAYELLLQVLLARLDDENGLQEYMRALEEAYEEAEEAEDKPQESEDSRTVAELKRRISAVSREYREEAAKVRNLQGERDELAREAESMRRELGELRTVVFNRENPQEEKEEEIPGISFPYTVKHRIVSFGGHPGWLKGMKEYLPDVRFISPDMLPNTMLLRTADAVWIQPNCMSHSDYYRIMNTAREQGVPVHYYAFDSAYKCAQQLAEADGRQ